MTEDKQWVDSLSMLEFAYNSSFHHAVGQSLFYVAQIYCLHVSNELQEDENQIVNQWASNY